MSTESFKAFAAKIREDQELQNEIRAASGENGVSLDELATLAAGHGYEFTAEDVSGELSDAELEGVAGGLGRGTIPKILSAVEGKIDIASLTSLDGTIYFKVTSL